jgi:hypothetical protein
MSDEVKINPNDEVLRIEINWARLFNLKTGMVRSPRSARVTYLTETKSGRDKWVPLLKGQLVSIAEGENVNDDPSVADLLEALARWARHEAETGAAE